MKPYATTATIVTLASSATSADELANEPTSPELSTDLIRIAYQIYSFIGATGRSHLHEVDREIGITIEYIYHHHPRPDQLGTVPASRARQSKRAGSAEPPDFPYHWATDVTAFRRSVRAFTDRITDYRRLPQLQAYVRSQDPPSTGTTPIRARSPAGNPITDQSEAQGNTSSTTPDSATTRNTTTRGTSESSAVMDEAAVRRIVNEAVQAAAVQFAAATAGSQSAGNQAAGRFNPAAEAADATAPTITTSRWNANELGFFDSHYDGKTVHSGAPPIEYTGKDTYFRDIHLFLDRAKQFMPAKGAETVRDNLWLSLRGTALSWWTSELSDTERRIVTYGKDLDEWSKLLTRRFKQPSFVAMESLLKESYTLKDAAAKREPREFAQRMLRTAKDAGINDVAPQLDLIYTNIDLGLRMYIQRPTEKSSIETFLTELDDRKYEWWAYATKKIDGSSYRSERPRHTLQRPAVNQSGQYIRQPFSSGMPYRPMGEGFQGQPRPFYGSNNPYGSGKPVLPSRPFLPARPPFNPPYQGNVNLQQYQPRQPPQGQQQQQQPLGRQPLQLTNGGTNQSPGQKTFTNQNQANQGGNGYNRDFNRNPFRKPFTSTRAYHAEGQENTPLDDQEAYQEYEDAFYQGWAGPSAEAYHEEAEEGFRNQVEELHDSEPDDQMQDTVEAHFIVPKPAKKSVLCRLCKEIFSSNNLLHKHIRECKKATAEVVQQPSQPSTGIRPGVEVFSVQLIESTAKDKPTPGHAFRGYRFATVKVSLTYQGRLYEFCFDTGCTMSLIDRAFLSQLMVEGGIQVEIRRMPSPIKVRGLGTKEHDACEYAIVPMYIPSNDNKVALIRREIHIVDDLSAKALIGIDIMKPEGIILDTNKDLVTIGSCESLQVPLSMVAKGSRTDAVVLSKAQYAVPAHTFMTVPIKNVTLPKDRDLIFEPEQLDALTLSAHIVDHNLTHIVVRNDTDLPTILPRHTRLGKVLEYEAAGCFQIDAKHTILADKPPRNDRSKSWVKRAFQGLLGTAAAFNAITAPNETETVHVTGATIYGSTTAATQAISDVVEAFPNLWKDTGNVTNVPEDQYMEIPLVDNWRDLYKAGQARVYPVGVRDKQVIDEAFDKLHDQGRMEWTTTSTPFSFPCFVVWKDTADGPKGRVVVDIRALNKITVPDAYPVPSQAEILSLLMHSTHISTIDAAAFFYQWWVKHHHRHRLTVSSHRGQETFNVPVMGYRNSPAYVQRMIDRILRPFRHFCRAYVDDIVIFSTSLEEHIRHLTLVFEALAEMNIHLAPNKAYLGYPSVQLLGQHVDALGLATSEDKLAAIRNLEFPRTLSALERYLGMTGYLKQYVPHYSAIVKPLQERKTLLNKGLVSTTGSARKSAAGRAYLQEPTPKELNAYHQLQGIFASPTMLHHHDPSRQLYVDLDASKEFGFGAHIYHTKIDDPGLPKASPPGRPPKASAEAPKQKSMQPILFLSRQLTPAETRYWPTELEMAGIVWVVKKIRHLIEASAKPTIIYTDHSAAISIVRQSSMNTTSTEKLNLRLIRASEYLQRFRIELRHKPGKANVVPDALSRLASRSYRSETDESILDSIDAFPVSLITVSEAFRRRLLEGYKEPRWTRVIAMVKENDKLEENAAKLAYKLIDDLLYFDDDENGLRLCIPSSMEAEVFKLAHDEMGHPGYARTHERLTQGLYIYNMATKLHEFIRHCPHCQLNQTPRHKPYGSLQPIYSPARPFHTLTIDFILALPQSYEGYDCVMSVTDKFSKAVTYIYGKTTWGSEEWAIQLLDRLAELNWGLPRAVISDRDRKFVGELWRQIFKALKVDLLYAAAWHPQTDGMSERSNQTAEIALRYYIACLDDPRMWPTILPRMSAALNNSTKYSSTSLAPTQVLYGFRTREALDLLRLEDPDDNTPTEAPPPTTVAAHPVTRSAARREGLREPSSVPATQQGPCYSPVPLPMPSVNPVPSTNPVPLPMPSAIRPASMSEYRPCHIDAKDAIAFASLRMKEHYDKRHQPKFFNVGDLVNLRLHKGYQVPAIRSKKIGPQLVGPFRVLKRIGRLAYQLELPDNMRIHDVISIAHLEPATDPARDPYKRRRPPPPAVVVDGEEEYQVERLVRKRRIRRGRGWSTQYLIRWLGYGPEHDTWQPEWTVADTLALDEFERLYGTDSAVRAQMATPVKAFYVLPYYYLGMHQLLHKP